MKPKAIIDIVCRVLDVEKEELISKSRERHIVEARQIAMYFIHRYCNLSLKPIGNLFGGRDHSTVIHARECVRDCMNVKGHGLWQKFQLVEPEIMKAMQFKRTYRGGYVSVSMKCQNRIIVKHKTIYT